MNFMSWYHGTVVVAEDREAFVTSWPKGKTNAMSMRRPSRPYSEMNHPEDSQCNCRCHFTR